MVNNIPKMNFAKIDELFSTEEERINDKLEKIKDIDIKDIDNFPNHPFKVIENAELFNLRDSIIEKGVLSPILVRPRNDGKYEVISGHRRKYASELADKTSIPCIVRDLTDDEAIIAMVDSNLQREHILPSEKAFAYKMKLEAEKHQGKRTLLTSCQVGAKLRTDSRVAKQLNESARQLHRFIRLTELIPQLLKMVDNKEIALSQAVEISFLKKEEQEWLFNSIERNLSVPSLSQALELKDLSKNGKLSEEKVEELLSNEKNNQIEKLKIEVTSLKQKMPKNIPQTKYKEYIFKALDYYNKHLERKNNRDR